MLNRNYLTIDVAAPASLTKPYDIALSAVCKAREAAIAGHKAGQSTSACFTFRNVICSVFTTPSGQLRYQVSPMGKPTRNDTHMLAVLTEAERSHQKAAEVAAKWVPMQAEVLYIDNQQGMEPTVTLKGRRDLALKGTYHRFGVGAIPRGQKGRQEHGGELVEGPWAFAFGLASCLTNSKALQDADAARRAQDIEVENGSELLIDGIWYTVRVERGEFIKLDPKA